MAGLSTFSGFHEPILRAVTDSSERSQPKFYPNVMRTITFTKHTETFQELARLGLAQDKNEFGPIVFDDPVQGNRREYQSRVKGLGYKFSWEAEEDDKYGVVVGTASSLGDSIRETQEVDAARIWNTCFAADTPAADMLTYDGRSIINSTHTLSGTVLVQANLFTGDVGLALLQSMRYYFRNLRNARGFRDSSRTLAAVMISQDPTTEPLLDQMLGGSGMQPFTADNTPHELGAMRTQIRKIVYPYMDDTDRTIGFSNKALSAEDGPFWANRRMPSMSSWDDESTQVSCHAMTYRFSLGCPNWIDICGSAG